jgi:hypothetical protein
MAVELLGKTFHWKDCLLGIALFCQEDGRKFKEAYVVEEVFMLCQYF